MGVYTDIQTNPGSGAKHSRASEQPSTLKRKADTWHASYSQRGLRRSTVRRKCSCQMFTRYSPRHVRHPHRARSNRHQTNPGQQPPHPPSYATYVHREKKSILTHRLHYSSYGRTVHPSLHWKPEYCDSLPAPAVFHQPKPKPKPNQTQATLIQSNPTQRNPPHPTPSQPKQLKNDTVRATYRCKNFGRGAAHHVKTTPPSIVRR